MRQIKKNMDIIKQKVSSLQGVELGFVVNKGRNKLENFDGKIDNVYPSIFTVSPSGGEDILSFSYNDIVTQNVRIFAKPHKS